MLESFWFEFGRWTGGEEAVDPDAFPLGVGGTAPTVREALDLVRRSLAQGGEVPPVMFVTEGVIAAPGDWTPEPPTPTGEPGIWWPRLTSSEAAVDSANPLAHAGAEPRRRGLAEVDFRTAALDCARPPAWPSAPVIPAMGSAVELLGAAGRKLGRPASADAIAAFEGFFGVTLPDDLRAVLLWSDGWEGELGDGWLSLNSIEELWQDNTAVRDLLPGLLNVGNDGSGATSVLDYRGSEVAQAFRAFDGIDDSCLRWIAPSLTEGLARLRVAGIPWPDEDVSADPDR